ncbi:hypothetical protein F4778DRAFT_779709 [Xylariomycetidae sp. FL2044]|nr:hypothetical protein F4778DRAFT_779709 [Xylariomycetidae sp. FL2044]
MHFLTTTPFLAFFALFLHFILASPTPSNDLLIAPSNGTTPLTLEKRDKFASSCFTPDIILTGTTLQLKAACKPKKGSTYRCTLLDLNRCYKDVNDEITADPAGRFFAAYDGCRLEPEGGGDNNNRLGCRNKKTNKVSWVNMNALISNDDGRLRCFDYVTETNC